MDEGERQERQISASDPASAGEKAGRRPGWSTGKRRIVTLALALCLAPLVRGFYDDAIGMYAVRPASSVHFSRPDKLFALRLMLLRLKEFHTANQRYPERLLDAVKPEDADFLVGPGDIEPADRAGGFDVERMNYLGGGMAWAGRTGGGPLLVYPYRKTRFGGIGFLVGFTDGKAVEYDSLDAFLASLEPAS